MIKRTVALVPPRFQVSCMIIATVYLSFIINERIERFKPKDAIPEIQTHTPQTLAALGGMPDLIQVGLYLDTFNTFDIVKNEFIANGTLWFILNPETIPLEVLGNFSLKRGIILEKSEPIIKLMEDQLFVQYKIRVSFATQLNYSAYPLDDHYVSLAIVNNHIAPQEALFITKEQDFTINPSIKIYGWDLVEKEVGSGYISTELEANNPGKVSSAIAAVFSLGYSFSGLRFAISVFLPLIMIFFISLFCLSFPDVARIGIAVGAVTALLAYRFVIDGISPEVGYFMLSDYLFFSVLASTFVVFFVIVVDAFGTYISVLGKKIIIAALHLTLLGIITYCIFGI